VSVYQSFRNERAQLLDHGYLAYLEHWGSDEFIVETARVSTDKGFLGWEPEFHYRCPLCKYEYTRPIAHEIVPHCPHCDTGSGTSLPVVLVSEHKGDQKLLRYLYKHRHSTPFEFAGLTIEVQAPIIVFREWHRHRTQAYSEMSARYVELPELFYIPSVERLMMVHSSTNRQATGRKPLTPGFAEDTRKLIKEQSEAAHMAYRLMLEAGVSRELARLVIPVNQYSRMRATAKLRNWLEFMTLRADETAQWEIRQYAFAVGNLLEQLFPRTFALWKEEKKNA
jgi:thymidylate synthase (FAD)